MNATLLTPVDGYTAIKLISRSGLHWIAKIIATGRLINVWDDEIEIDADAEILEG